MKQPKQITFAERAAQKIAARKRTEALIASGAITPHEAQLKAAPYSDLPVKIVDLKAALAQRYHGSKHKRR